MPNMQTYLLRIIKLPAPLPYYESCSHVHISPAHTASWVLSPAPTCCDSRAGAVEPEIQAIDSKPASLYLSGCPSAVPESNVSIPWKIVRNANSGTLPQTGWIQFWKWDQAMCVERPCKGPGAHYSLRTPASGHRGGAWRGCYLPWEWCLWPSYFIVIL